MERETRHIIATTRHHQKWEKDTDPKTWDAKFDKKNKLPKIHSTLIGDSYTQS
jgi:hypothetical protein